MTDDDILLAFLCLAFGVLAFQLVGLLVLDPIRRWLFRRAMLRALDAPWRARRERVDR